MRNHWHFVIWPREDGELTAFVRWLAHTHAMRWHVAHGTVGCGHLYQGRFKSFPVERDNHKVRLGDTVERVVAIMGTPTYDQVLVKKEKSQIIERHLSYVLYEREPLQLNEKTDRFIIFLFDPGGHLIRYTSHNVPGLESGGCEPGRWN